MKDKIKESIKDPEKLEQLYQNDKTAFASGFEAIYPEIENSELSKFWKIRLDYGKIPVTKNIILHDILILICACLLSGFLIKLPVLFSFHSQEIFYMKNAALIVFFGLTLYTFWTRRITKMRKLISVVVAVAILTVYVNLLPWVTGRDSIDLIYIHLPLLLWFIFGVVNIDFNLNDNLRRIEYIRFNGDMAILMALIVIAGGILTAITIGLFQAIGIHVEKFYMDYVVMAGAVSVPVVASFILGSYPALANKIAPVIANIFSPLVLITAIAFLAALAVSGKSPYNDRNFLIMFNAMLIGVMAVIVFSVSETSSLTRQKFTEMILLILSIITVIIDLIALSAIFYRLGTFGLTPNRLAVLGSNILILINLVMIIIDLYKVNFRKALIKEVELTTAKYLPVYLAWIVFVVVAFPLIFGMK